MFARAYFPATYFPATYFGGNGTSLADITSTRKIQLPVDCVLAGQQPYRESGREYEIRDRNATERGGWNRTRVARLKGSRPSFTTTTNNRGYE